MIWPLLLFGAGVVAPVLFIVLTSITI